eukprot:scaffold1482_cov120-Cylindrotheca_fusiformis.AAC.11
MPKRTRSNDELASPSVDPTIWSRVIKRRRRDFDSLGQTVANEILANISTTYALTPQDNLSPKDTLELWLQDHAGIAADRRMPATRRRASWNIVSSIASLIDSKARGEANESQIQPISSSKDSLDGTHVSSSVSLGTAAADSSTATTPTSKKRSRVDSSNPSAGIPTRKSSSSTSNAPVHPSMEGNRSTSNCSASTSTHAVHPSMSLGTADTAANSPAPSATAGTTTKPSNSKAPVHPSMMGNGSVGNLGASASNLPVHPSMLNNTAPSISTTRAPRHPSMLAPVVSANASTSAVPVHPSIRGLPSSSSTASELQSSEAASSSTTPVHPAMQPPSTTIPVHPAMQPPSTTGPVHPAVQASTASSSNPPVHPALREFGTNITQAVRPSADSNDVSTISSNYPVQGAQSTNGEVASSLRKNDETPLNGNLPLHPSLSQQNTATRKPNGVLGASSALSNANAIGNTPAVHPSMQQASAATSGTTSVAALPPATMTSQQSSRTPTSVAAPTSTKSTTRTASSKENEVPNSITPVTPTTRETAPVEPEPPIIDSRTTTIHFPLDEGMKYSGALDQRPPCQVKFRKHKIPKKEALHFGARLASSEPFWFTVKVVASGMTSPTESTTWATSGKMGMRETLPKTVATFSIRKMAQEVIEKVKNWGTEGSTQPKDGECRLLLRMLPVKKETKLMQRADCHLWPKGTFATVNDTALCLKQRQQQSHDYKKWLGMSRHFDMATEIRFPHQSQTVNICCRDTDQYYISLALCEYRSPEFLVRKLQGLQPECNSRPAHHTLQFLSYRDSVQKAKESINKQMVVLDDDDSGDKVEGQSVGKFVFSLIDPLTKVPMTTPVRGKKCKHWQCFDLRSFLQSCLPVSGSRWRCAACELFLEYHELQHCGLTKAALEKFEGETSANRGRVEFRSDGGYDLLPSQRLRYAATRHSSGGNGTKKSNGAENVKQQ